MPVTGRDNARLSWRARSNAVLPVRGASARVEFGRPLHALDDRADPDPDPDPDPTATAHGYEPVDLPELLDLHRRRE